VNKAEVCGPPCGTLYESSLHRPVGRDAVIRHEFSSAMGNPITTTTSRTTAGNSDANGCLSTHGLQGGHRVRLRTKILFGLYVIVAFVALMYASHYQDLHYEDEWKQL